MGITYIVDGPGLGNHAFSAVLMQRIDERLRRDHISSQDLRITIMDSPRPSWNSMPLGKLVLCNPLFPLNYPEFDIIITPELWPNDVIRRSTQIWFKGPRYLFLRSDLPKVHEVVRCKPGLTPWEHLWRGTSVIIEPQDDYQRAAYAWAKGIIEPDPKYQIGEGVNEVLDEILR